jgi:hypothetical protein
VEVVRVFSAVYSAGWKERRQRLDSTQQTWNTYGACCGKEKEVRGVWQVRMGIWEFLSACPKQSESRKSGPTAPDRFPTTSSCHGHNAAAARDDSPGKRGSHSVRICRRAQ